MRISSIQGREILDSRGNPTVEADVILENGLMGRASVPSGASTGSREAFELRDAESPRYNGKGVRTAVQNINHGMQQALIGMSVIDQEYLDLTLQTLDGTLNKSHLGANAILAVSLAAARAIALSLDQPLFMALHQQDEMCMPVPMINILNGGMHADNNIDVQEFMIMPVGANDFPEALRMSVETFHALKSILRQSGLSSSVGDEGGFAPNVQSNRHALDLLARAIELAGLSLGKDMVFALDVAASELYQNDRYILASEGLNCNADEIIQYYTQLIQDYPIVSIEDGLSEHDILGWQKMTLALGAHVQLVGDDLFATNPLILQQGIHQHMANAVLIKLNQIGTLTETRTTLTLAKQNGYRAVISHRSGETEDTFIADLAVASGCGQIKTGSVCRTDRVAKYNQLLRINAQMNLPYAGYATLKQHQGIAQCERF